ncbi:MAG: hypothetical protein E7058_06475 [Lentisphaerae bacterium]|nr:hypothetical protein [Lentisphaerota bacterium]
MKNNFLLIVLCGALACLFCSCSSFEPTRSLEEAFAHVENDLQYHNRQYMEQMQVGDNMVVPDIKKIGKLYFAVALEKQGNSADDMSNSMSDEIFAAFQREFENATAGCGRFPVAQMHHGLQDKNLRKKTHDGTANVADFDASELKKAEANIHVTPMRSQSSNADGVQRTTTYTFKLVCNPLAAVNNAPMGDFPPFSVQFASDIRTITDRFGRTKEGLRLDDFRSNAGNRLMNDLALRQGRAAIVKFFAHVYKCFPVGGMVTNFDEDGRALFKANRAMGLQKNMECVIFGIKKGDPDAIAVPLFNATVTVLSQTGNSTLQIWRESEKKTARRIIQKIRDDFDEAKEDYEFFACADGFAEWPDFVEQQNRVQK